MENVAHVRSHDWFASALFHGNPWRASRRQLDDGDGDFTLPLVLVPVAVEELTVSETRGYHEAFLGGPSQNPDEARMRRPACVAG